MKLHAYIEWMHRDLAYKPPEGWPGVLAQHLRFMAATYPDVDAREDKPAALSDEEFMAAIELCRVVGYDENANVKGHALGRLRVLLDRFPGTPTSTEGAATA